MVYHNNLCTFSIAQQMQRQQQSQTMREMEMDSPRTVSELQTHHGHQSATSVKLSALQLLIIFTSIALIFIIIILRLITGSYLISLAIICLLLVILLKKFGTFVMYPCSFFVMKIMDRSSQTFQLLKSIQTFCNALNTLAKLLTHNQPTSIPDLNTLPSQLTIHISQVLTLFTIYQATLSVRKTSMLHIYRYIDSILRKQHSDNINLYDLISHPYQYINDAQRREYFSSFVAELLKARDDLLAICFTYGNKVQGNLLPTFKQGLFEESFYEYRFEYLKWSQKFHYELETIISDGDNIQAAIIHSLLDNTSSHQQIHSTSNIPANDPCVIICNPNGIIMQRYGHSCRTVSLYLEMGYQVIMWNYRGYGMSTGTPSIRKSQKDALEVYKHFTKLGYRIVHVQGTSIGGVAAVGLAYQLQLQNDTTIESIIIDRSFSSIGKMADSVITQGHYFVQLLFGRDNINIAEQYAALHYRKLCIWDRSDQIIPDSASLRSGIVQLRHTVTPKHTDKQLLSPNVQLQIINQNSDRIIPAADSRSSTASTACQQQNDTAEQHDLIQRLIDRWTSTIVHIIDLNNTQNTNDNKNTNTNNTIQYKDDQQNKNKEEQLIALINKVDGGGITAYSNHNKMRHLRIDNHQQLMRMCQEYVLGLLRYGSVLSLCTDPPIPRNSTTTKLTRLIEQLQQIYSLGAYPQFRFGGSLQQQAANLCHIYQKILELLQQQNNFQRIDQYGWLMATQNGHNSELKREEYDFIVQFVKGANRFVNEGVSMKELTKEGFK